MSKSMGQIIRSLRKERGLTQEELAEQLNITYQAVSRWENNTGMPDISQIVPLANVFGVSTDVFLVRRIPIVKRKLTSVWPKQRIDCAIRRKISTFLKIEESVVRTCLLS